jgi:serine O-acetyltransferase
MSVTSPDGLSLRDLVFSDLVRFRPTETPTWRGVLKRCLSTPGMLASVVLRTQQVAFHSGHVKTASLLRTVGLVILGADLNPGMTVGPGLMMPHPPGIVIGQGLVVGANVTFAQGVTAGHQYPDRPSTGLPTICDGAIVLANAVLVGPIRIGQHAMVGPNAVVLSDVPDHAVMVGSPARQVSKREGIIPGSFDEL